MGSSTAYFFIFLYVYFLYEFYTTSRKVVFVGPLSLKECLKSPPRLCLKGTVRYLNVNAVVKPSFAANFIHRAKGENSGENFIHRNV